MNLEVQLTALKQQQQTLPRDEQQIAETTGDTEGAGRAQLSIIEELGDKMNAKELISTFHSALDLSKDSQDPLTLRRLIACMEVVLTSLQSASEILKPLKPWIGIGKASR